jgi:hypothetical protein
MEFCKTCGLELGRPTLAATLDNQFKDDNKTHSLPVE